MGESREVEERRMRGKKRRSLGFREMRRCYYQQWRKFCPAIFFLAQQERSHQDFPTRFDANDMSCSIYVVRFLMH